MREWEQIEMIDSKDMVGIEGKVMEPYNDTFKDLPRSAGADVDLPVAKKTVGQCSQILHDLKRGYMVPNDLYHMNLYGCIRIGARIHDLRHGKYDGTHYSISGDGTPDNPYRLEE